MIETFIKVMYCISVSNTDRRDVMFTLNSKSPVPIFEQIVEQVGKYITLGVLKPNDQLPTVRTLAKELGINPNTVAKAYKICEETNLIYSEIGKGYFVSNTKAGVSNVLEGAYNDLLRATQYLISIGESKEQIIQHIEKELL